MSNFTDKEYNCPLCGVSVTKRTQRLRDRFTGFKVPAGAGLNFAPGEAIHPFYNCQFCNIKYQDISDFDIESREPRVKRPVIEGILSRYGEHGRSDFKDIISQKNRTGIIRRIGAYYYFIRRSSPFIICLNINNIRMGITCTRDEANDRCYVAESIWSPGKR